MCSLAQDKRISICGFFSTLNLLFENESFGSCYTVVYYLSKACLIFSLVSTTISLSNDVRSFVSPGRINTLGRSVFFLPSSMSDFLIK